MTRNRFKGWWVFVAVVFGLAVPGIALGARDAANWVQTQKLIASDADLFDFLGGTVVVTPSVAVAHGTSDTGAVYVFEPDEGGSWREVQKIVREPFSGFGVGAAICDEKLWLGQAAADPAGAVFGYRRDADGGWVEEQKLQPSDGYDYDNFGGSIACTEDRVVVGASTFDVGSAYVFDRGPDGEWAQTESAKLTASDPQAGDFFGSRVALAADVAFVGAWGTDDVEEQTGAVFVFERQFDGSWVEIQKLQVSDGGAGDRLGTTIAIDGDTVAIGAGFDDENGTFSGSTYIFVRDDVGWVETQKLVASDAAEFGWFGDGLAIDRGTLLIGADGADGRDGEESSTGAVYVFERDPTGVWHEVQKVLASDGADGDKFGRGIALSGRTAMIGATRTDDAGNGSNSGAVYVFRPERCEIELLVEPRIVSLGEPLTIELSLEHLRRESATVPFRLWIEDADGAIVLSQQTRDLEFDFLDRFDRELVLMLPDGIAPGSYRLVAGIDEMAQGVAWAAVEFEVE